MKKVYIILFMLIFCTFAIPIIFTKNTVSGKIQNDTEEIKENTLEEIEMIDYDYKQYDTIKLFLCGNSCKNKFFKFKGLCGKKREF